MPPLIKKLNKKVSGFIDKVKSSTSRSPKEDSPNPAPALGGDAAAESAANLTEPVAEPVPDPTSAPGADSAAESAFNLAGQIAQSVSVPMPPHEADPAAESTAGLTGHDAEQATPVDQIATSAEGSHGASSRTPVTCWDRAFQKLQEMNKQVYDDLQAIADYKQASPDDITKSAEERVNQLGDFQSSDPESQKWFTCRNLLKTISRGMTSMKDVVMPLARLEPHGALPVALAIAFGGIYTLVQVVSNENTEYMFCLTSIVELRPMIARWVHYEGRFMVYREASLLGKYKDLENAMVDLYQAILTFLAAMARYCAGSLIKRFAKAIAPNIADWQRQLGQIKAKDSNCKSYKEILTGETEFEKQNVAILKWLSMEDPQSTHRKVLEKTNVHTRYKHAGQWVFGTEEYREWSGVVQRDRGSDKCETPMCLWLDGNLGTGKTTVMAQIIQNALEYPVSNTQDAVFYFSKVFSDAANLTPIAFLRSLVRQLSWDPGTRNLSGPTRALHMGLKHARPDSGELEKQECMDVLVKIVQGRHCRIFIDALDECSNPDDLLVFLRDLHDKAKETTSEIQLQLVISSRPYVNVQKHFKFLPGYHTATARLSIVDHQPDSDMETFVVTELQNKRKDFADRPLFTSPQLADRLIHVLLERAGSMFRWVELQIELFTNRSQQSHESIEHRLNRLEGLATFSGLSDLEKLTQAYQEVYDIEKDATSKLRAILIYKLLLCAFANLSVEDLVEAIRSVAKPEHADKVNAQHIEDICSCFLTGSDPVRFAHASAREFLEQLKDETGALVYAPENQHEGAAILCLSTIERNGSRLTALAAPDIQSLMSQPFTGFLWYSCFHWPFHCTEVPSSRRTLPLVQGSESITQHVADFVISPSFIGWQKVIHFRSYEFATKKISRHMCFIQQDALKGCIPRSEVDANGRWEYRNRPSLLIATFNFHELIDVMASRPLKRMPIVLDDENRARESVLVRACRCNAYDTLKILQTRFPKDFMMLIQMAQSGRTVSGLHHAIDSGSVEVVSFLLEHGADVFAYVRRRDFQGQITGTTLHRAISLDSVAILDALLQHTREKLGEEKLLELLLLQDDSKESAWRIAIMQRSVLVLEVLLRHASSANILRQLLLNESWPNGTALNYFAVDIPSIPNSNLSRLEPLTGKFELLLKYAGQLPKEALHEVLTTLSAKGSTALHSAASAIGSIEHVEKLLRSAWSASEDTLAKLLQRRSRDGRTALHMAAGLPLMDSEKRLMVLIEFANYCAPSDFLAKYLRLETVGGKTARDIAAGWQPENKVTILDDVLARVLGPSGVWNPRLDIVSEDEDAASLEECPEDEEWYRLWKSEQRERRNDVTNALAHWRTNSGQE